MPGHVFLHLRHTLQTPYTLNTLPALSRGSITRRNPAVCPPLPPCLFLPVPPSAQLLSLLLSLPFITLPSSSFSLSTFYFNPFYSPLLILYFLATFLLFLPSFYFTFLFFPPTPPSFLDLYSNICYYLSSLPLLYPPVKR